ncbi:MAG: PDZ domain-containing protein [Sulfurimonas sp.]
MFRLFTVLTLLFLNLYACKGGYNSCRLKINDSNSLTNNLTNISVTKHSRVIFSRTRPQAKILKYDPFLSLYLVQDKKGFRYPFQIRYTPLLGLACVDKKRAIEGKITKHQVGLNHFATFSEPVLYPSIILTSCCSLEGIVTPRGIIEKAYIDRFVKIKKVSYADIGIRVKDDKNLVLVSAINPFLDGNSFQINDAILSFDGKKVKNASKLMQWILFSKIASSHIVKIKRGSKLLTLKMKNSKRNGGGYLSDTFLEFLGISFDKNLRIIKIQKKAKKYQLKLGDRLIQVNQKNITTQNEILKIISQSKDSSNLLFQRYDFQFFVTIKSI